MKSPCVKVCKIKKGIDYISLGSQLICVGCGRTLEQIRDWTTYTDEQRDSIMGETKWSTQVCCLVNQLNLIMQILQNLFLKLTNFL